MAQVSDLCLKQPKFVTSIQKRKGEVINFRCFRHKSETCAKEGDFFRHFIRLFILSIKDSAQVGDLRQEGGDLRQEEELFFSTYCFSMDCFVPRNDDACCCHCEERSNPEKSVYQSIAKFVIGRNEAIQQITMNNTG